MSCLKGYIGVKGPNMPVPVSGLYVNSLPGITLGTLDKTANEEQQTFFQVWDDVENRGITRFMSNISSALSANYRLKAITQAIDIGRIIQLPKVAEAPAAQLKGFAIEMRLAAYYRQSTLMAVNVQTLSLYSENTQAGVAIKVMDIETNQVIDTLTLDCVQGWNTLQVNKRYNAQRLFIGYDATNVTSAYLPIYSGWQTAFMQTIATLYGPGSGQAYLRGAETTDPANATNLSYDSFNSHGLSAVFSLVCKWDNLICNNKDVFANCLWYCMGSELMVQLLASQRFNWITMDKDRATELKNYFDKLYNEEMANIVRSLDIDTRDACIVCNAPVMIKEASM